MTSSTSVVAEGSQHSDIVTIHRDSFARDGGWVHCSFGQVHACSGTHKPGSSSLTNSPGGRVHNERATWLNALVCLDPAQARRVCVSAPRPGVTVW